MLFGERALKRALVDLDQAFQSTDVNFFRFPNFCSYAGSGLRKVVYYSSKASVSIKRAASSEQKRNWMSRTRWF